MQVSLQTWRETAATRARVRALAGDEVQVWMGEVAAEGALGVAGMRASGLVPEEQERAWRLPVEAVRREFVAGRALLRRLVGECLGLEPSAVPLATEPGGKPCLVSGGIGRDLKFNLSHSDGRILVALAWGRRVGVDLESETRLGDWRAYGDRVFAAEDWQRILACSGEHGSAAFLRGWTCKEAYLKATGEGLIDAIHEVRVTLGAAEAPGLVSVPGGVDVGRWRVDLLPVPAGWAGALVTEVLESERGT